ncbi:glycosyltransferase family 2 protein [Flammeovirga sp. EKP202]|uniref:glycosyltransferase family 2 protein n=1 Tax=Flammeovirga sp. EKP202 TaxID=2770592 RepID=UPI00165FB678|nr:glycosyltransferase family 2 protein [Flammeovirga sp. EKP202]MBD0400817.1 glycosyltransferase family 2 protein [Flammeovirga sp. EKP202]
MKVSIVIPVYNSEKIVTTTVNEIIKVLNTTSYTFEIILINDGSPDNSWNVIKELANNNNNIISINLHKNYGQHNAVLCGFENASGDYIVTMDDDMQNPPSELIPLINSIVGTNYDLVFGKFKEKKHAQHRKLGSKVVGYLNAKVFNKPKDVTLTNFRIIKRDVIEKIINYKTSYPYIPGLALMFASKIKNVEVEHAERTIGQSNYTFKKIFQLVSRLMINYSSFPLRVLSSFGFLIAGISFTIGITLIIKQILFGSKVQGWTSIMVLLSFFSGFIIILLGIIGEYLSRILDQLSSHKSYHIREIIK